MLPVSPQEEKRYEARSTAVLLDTFLPHCFAGQHTFLFAVEFTSTPSACFPLPRKRVLRQELAPVGHSPPPTNDAPELMNKDVHKILLACCCLFRRRRRNNVRHVLPPCCWTHSCRIALLHNTLFFFSGVSLETVCRFPPPEDARRDGTYNLLSVFFFFLS